MLIGRSLKKSIKKAPECLAKHATQSSMKDEQTKHKEQKKGNKEASTSKKGVFYNPGIDVAYGKK